MITDSYSWSDDKKIYIEDYDSSFKLQSKHEIVRELDLFGCFFSGAEHNYLVYGQQNPNEDDSVEVIRVVKYSKNWERLGQAGIYGANTTIPFSFGSCRCAESDGMLYIRTCHRMYKTEDGLNHQANMMLVIRESDMAVTSQNVQIANISSGYVSHSFDQYVLADQEGNIVGLDLGDAYPREVVLTRYSGRAGSESLGNVSTATIQEISGKIGDNYTGVTIGGFAETSSGYVTAYTYNGGSGDPSVYLAYTDKHNLNTRAAKLTAPSPVSTLRLVPTGITGGYILWNTPSDQGMVLYYASYSTDGSIGEIHTARVDLASKYPIFYNGKVVWSDGTIENLRSYQDYDMIVNMYLLDDTGVETITLPAYYPYVKPIFY